MPDVPIKLTNDPVFKRDRATREDADGSFYRDDLAPGTARIVDYFPHVPLTEPCDGRFTLNYVCPCGCGHANTISLYASRIGHGWYWNGDRERPTLTPSIQQLNRCRWHGHLTAGVWKQC